MSSSAPGNVALQAFSVVTQTPRRLNYEHNGNDTDSIFWLGLTQAWPPRALGSLMERALYQADRLRKPPCLERQTSGLSPDRRNFAAIWMIAGMIRNSPPDGSRWRALMRWKATGKSGRLKEAGFRMMAPPARY